MTRARGEAQSQHIAAPRPRTDHPAKRRRLASRKLIAFVALCTICLTVAVGHVLQTRARRVTPVDPSAVSVALPNEPHVLYRSMSMDGGAGQVAVARLDSADTLLALTDLRCDRVHMASGYGLCLTQTQSVFGPYQALFFGSDLRVYQRRTLAGIPSRARVSPDGVYSATTVFVSGDSYAREGFSTRTTIFTMSSAKPVADLERFEVYLNGKRIHSVDFNFWGVTFARAGLFYATLGTKGHTYLVRGDVAARRVEVLRDGVECPSLSPDGTRVAFKSRTKNTQPYEWRPAVLDLETLEEHTLAETRSINDQIEWLDNDRVLYAVDTGFGAPSTWVASADGTGEARRFISEGDSPAVIRS